MNKKTVTDQLKTATRQQLLDVQQLVNELLSTMTAEAKAEAAASKPKPKHADTAEYIELRMVKRGGKEFGPYRYRRWWQGGKLRAKYLGKGE